jgi:hypothetical protein
MERADVANGEGDPEALEQRTGKSPADDSEHRTGARQARENAENDPPA